MLLIRQFFILRNLTWGIWHKMTKQPFLFAILVTMASKGLTANPYGGLACEIWADKKREANG